MNDFIKLDQALAEGELDCIALDDVSGGIFPVAVAIYSVVIPPKKC